MPNFDALDAAILGEDDGGQRQQLRASVLAARQNDPDQFARARRLSRETGLPAPVVARNLPEVQQRSDLERLDDLIAGAPRLAERMANDNEFASVAHDNTASLAEIEALVNPRLAAGRIGGRPFYRPVGSMQAEERTTLGELTEPVRRGVARAGVGVTLLAGEAGLYDDARSDQAVRLAQRQRGVERYPTPEHISRGLDEVARADTFGGALTALMNNPAVVREVALESLGTSSPALVAGASGSVFGPWGIRAGTFAGSLAVEYASVIAEAAQERGAPLTTPEGWDAALHDEQFLEAAREKGIKRALPIAVFDAVTAGFAGRLVAKAKPTVASVAARSAGELGVQAAGGAAGEATAQAVTGEFHPGDILLEAIAELPSAVVEVPANYRHARRAAEERIASAQDHADALTQLAQLAEADKVRGRDPESFQQFVAHAAEDGPLEAVWVNPNTLAQSGVDVEALAQVSPSFAAQLNTALESGGEIRIPTEEFATALPGTGLEQGVIPHLRTDPDAMTMTEAQTFMQEQATEFAAEAKRLVAENEDTTAAQEGYDAVKAAVLEDLTATGRFTKDVNDLYAGLVANFYTARANEFTEAGTPRTAKDLFETYKLRTQAEGVVTERSLSQNIAQTETPEFKAWFGDSKVVDAEGKPLVVYHGTITWESADGRQIGNIEQFDRLASVKTVRRGHSIDTIGSWFSSRADKQGAGMYGDTIYPVHLAIANPHETTFQLLERRARLLANGKDDGRKIGEAEVNAVRKWLKDMGKDGIKIAADPGNDRRSTEFDAQDVWIALEPEQIKSAIGNNGQFDPKNPNILAQNAFLPDAVTIASPSDFVPGKVKDILSKDGWAILTAENPGAEQISAEDNAARVAQLKAELEKRGIHYQEVKGKYGGNVENSVIVFGVDRWTASALGNKYGQESVLTRDGLLYADGTVNPATGVEEHAKAPEDFYSWLPHTGATFSVQIDFDQRVPVGPGFISYGRAALDSVSVPAVHFSRERRTNLSSSHYGTGIAGAEAGRLTSATDTRLARRLAFYVPEGSGVYPEQGVGAVAHGAMLHNLYDAEADPLRLWRDNADLNDKESAVLNAGFAGYYARGNFGNQGTAVLLGTHSLQTTPIEGNVNSQIGALSAPPAAPNPSKEAAGKILQNRMLPWGEQLKSGWIRDMERYAPDLAAFVPWDTLPDDRPLRRDDLARAVYSQPAYHGTHVKGIDRFSTEFMGTGEGIQAFGWGLYFAGDKGIAEYYRKMLTSETPIAEMRLGTTYVYRNESPVDYSPRLKATDEEMARAAAIERLMIIEPSLRTAWYAEGIEGVRREVLAELDFMLKLYAEEGTPPAYTYEIKALRRYAAGKFLHFRMAEEEGQVYKVDIPEHDEYLDWEKPLSEQSPRVQKALQQAGVAQSANESGRVLYKRLSLDRGGLVDFGEPGSGVVDMRPVEDDEAASRYLNSLGISGIRYRNGPSRDGVAEAPENYNYVVFDDNAIRIIEELYQPNNRGQISFGTDLTQSPSFITLLQGADLSTFLHETGHFFLEMYTDLAAREDTPAKIKADFGRILDWFGVTDAQWRAMSVDEKRPYHEQFARGFESYLFEGKAPTLETAGMFSRFRAWLIAVYKDIKALKVQLTDEVRGVFDRMLASEQQIKLTEQARAMTPMYATKPEGMSPADWEAYQAAAAAGTEEAGDELRARSLRNMQWLSRARSRNLKALQKAAEEQRKQVETEVYREVRQMPVYAAQHFLKSGALPNGEKMAEGFRLAIPALEEMYMGDGDRYALLDWKPLVTRRLAAAEGLHPDVVANLIPGFTSGDQLVKELLAAEPEQSVVDGLTDRRMLERYGDMSDERSIQRAADAAVHNEARARFVAIEYKALARATGSVPVLMSAAKEAARRVIAEKKIRELKPSQYSAAEGRASKEAMKAAAKSDLVAAATAKRNQLLNNAFAREAMDQAGEVEKAVRYLKRFDKESTRKSIDIDYREQIDAILERFDLRTGQSLKAIDKRVALADWIKRQEEMGLTPAIDERVAEEAYRTHYKNLTVEQFKGVVDSIRNIEHLGRLKKQLLTAKGKREFAEVVRLISESVIGNAKRTIPEARMSDRGVLVETKRLFKNFLVDHRKFASQVRELDGWRDGGTAWEYLVRTMNERGDFEAVEREKATIALGELLKPILKGEKLTKKTFFANIGKSFTREERIGIALNMGNETNRERVLTGESLSPVQLQAILDTLSKEEWDFVQGVWDYFDTFRPLMADKERRLTGVEPEWVQPLPVMTRFGTYRGGYYPIKADPLRSSRAEADVASEVQRQIERGLYTRATTRRGHLKARTESTGRPLRYDLGVIPEHVAQVVHDLAWHEWLVDANRLVRAAPIDGAVRDHYGPEVLRMMRDTLKDIAVGEVGATSGGERILAHLRTGATIAGLGWRVTTSLLQPFGLTQSIVRIGSKWVAKGAAHWIGDTVRFENSAKKIYEKSAFMRLRGKTMQREINEIRNKVTGDDSLIEASYFYLIQKMQLVADIPTWWGAYEKAMHEDGMTEDKAVALADQAVIDAQGAGQVKDLSAIQRGGQFQKLWTNFYSFFNTTFNLSREAVGRTNFKSPGSVALLAVDMALLYSIPALLGTVLKAALSGDWEDEDKLVRKLIADQINYLFGTVLVLREAGGVAGAIIDPQGGMNYTGPAGVRFFAELAKLGKQVGQGEADEAFWKALNSTLGILFHYPAGQINSTASGAVALAEERTDNPGALLVGAPRD